TDASSAISVQYTFDPFGGTTTSGSGANVFEYSGRENDGNGLYGFRARYYSPGFGRFLSEDPLELMTAGNGYAYAGDDPADLVDPLGLQILPPGVTHHPPKEAGRWGCKGSDPCVVLRVKLSVAGTVLVLHKLIDLAKPGEHDDELPELQNAIDNCRRWIEKRNCNCDDSPWNRPATPEEQRQIDILRNWLAGLTGALMAHWWLMPV